MMFVNLHKVPAGQSYYTAYLADKREDGTFEPGDEIDFIAKRGLSGQAAQTAAYDSDEFKRGYLSLARGGTTVVVGVVDQSDGEVCSDYRESYGIARG